MDEQIDVENEDDVADGQVTAPRGRGKKKTAKKKSAGSKVDDVAALAFCRSRLSAAKSMLEEAFWKQEVAAIEERVKKAAAAARANLSISVNGGVARIGSHVFEVTGCESYGGSGKPGLAEYVVSSIFDQKETYGTRTSRTATLKRVHGTGDRRIDAGAYGQSKHYYLSPRAAVDHALLEAKRKLIADERDVASRRAKHDALVELRAKAPDKAPEPTPPEKIGKAKIAKTTSPRRRTTRRVASRSAVASLGKRWTDDENKRLRICVEAGEKPESIAIALGRSRDRVVRQMHKLGIKPTSTPFHDFRGGQNVDARSEDRCAAATDDGGACGIIRRSHALISNHAFEADVALPTPPLNGSLKPTPEHALA